MLDKNRIAKLAGTMLLAMSAVLAAGCSADGDGDLGIVDGGIIGGDPNDPGFDPSTDFPNNGTVPSTIEEDGVALAGNFICSRSAGRTATTEVGARGLLGDSLLGGLLNLLGAGTLTKLLASVTNENDAIDGDFGTHSTFAMTLDLLGLLSGVEQSVLYKDDVDKGGYAVFAVAFPTATLELSLGNSVAVTTYNNNILQETVSSPVNTLDLLGIVGLQERFGFVGVKTTKPYDRATITLTNLGLSVNVGEAMHVYDFCSGGRMVAATP